MLKVKSKIQKMMHPRLQNMIRLHIFFLCFGIIIYQGCHRASDETEKTGIVQESTVTAMPDRESWDATIRVSSEGKLKSVISYGHMTYYEHQKVNYFNEGVQVDLFDDQGNHTTKLTAEKGEYHENSQNIWAIGNVVVVSDTGATLCTPIMRWDNEREKIISDTTVMVTTVEKDTIYGSAFQSDADLTHMIIQNPYGSHEEGVDFEELEESLNAPVITDTIEEE